ncbi:MAG: c-type cytochrome [Oceanipulchritudo sp.]
MPLTVNSSKRIVVILVAYVAILCAVLLSSGRSVNHPINAAGETRRAITGKQIWQNSGCIVCHSIYGLGGHLGPDLTNVRRRFDGTYIRYIIKNGFRKMPAYPLEQDELEALVQYFDYLNQLGTYPLQSPLHDAFGSNREPH